MPPQTMPSRHKDLQDLRDLPRAPLQSYVRKGAQPKAPRSEALKAQPATFPALAAFSPTRWKWIWEYLSHRFGRRHPFPTYAGLVGDNGIYPLRGDDGDAGEIRLALAADWGTGTDEANDVAKQIAAFGPHYAIHLGDVYYVGDPAEVDENFLGKPKRGSGFAPVRWPPGSRGTFALNANHEMYALGYAYFDAILPALGLMAGGRPQGQRASFFCLENEHWRIVALDTGYYSIGFPGVEYFFQPSCALPQEIVDWLRNVVKPRRDDPRGIVILTHHPYVSRFDHGCAKPARQLAEFFSGPLLWFWGHEHRLAIYREVDKPGGIHAFGRCIGHGGMPIDLGASKVLHPEVEIEFCDERPYPNDENLNIGFNGFARLAFDGPRLRVDYVDLHGTVVFSESWTAERGTLAHVGSGPGSRG